MMTLMKTKLPLFFFAAVIIWLPSTATGSTKSDQSPPVIRFDPVSQHRSGQTLRITAGIQDDSYIIQAHLFFRNEGETAYQSLTMEPTGGDQYQAGILEECLKGRFLDYYLSAEDEAGNIGQSGSKQHPYHVKVLPVEKKQTWYKKVGKYFLHVFLSILDEKY